MDVLTEYIDRVVRDQNVRLERELVQALALQACDKVDRLHVVYVTDYRFDPVPPAVASFWGPTTDDIVSRHALHSLAMSCGEETGWL